METGYRTERKGLNMKQTPFTHLDLQKKRAQGFQVKNKKPEDSNPFLSNIDSFFPSSSILLI